MIRAAACFIDMRRLRNEAKQLSQFSGHGTDVSTSMSERSAKHAWPFEWAFRRQPRENPCLRRSRQIAGARKRPRIAAGPSCLEGLDSRLPGNDAEREEGPSTILRQ